MIFYDGVGDNNQTNITGFLSGNPFSSIKNSFSLFENLLFYNACRHIYFIG